MNLSNQKIVRTYWRDNANPFPGRLLSERAVRLTAADLRWLEYTHRCEKERLEKQIGDWARFAKQIEDLADQACEDCHD